MRLATILTMALATSILFDTPVAATHNSAADTGPEKIEQVECSSAADVTCHAERMDISLRNNLINSAESFRGIAEKWDERGQEWQQSDYETVKDLGEWASEEADGGHNQIDHQQEIFRNNTIPELIPKLIA